MIVTDLFAEDRAQEELLRPLLQRLASEHNQAIQVRTRSARGGHPRAIAELRLYQKGVEIGVSGLTLPDLLVVAIDANCDRVNAARRRIQENISPPFQDRTVIACPDPHIERWYLADVGSFGQVVGVTPKVGKKKCDRDRYKAILSRAVSDAGHPSTLGGIEFARELVEAMDLYRAGKTEASLRRFLEDAAARFKAV